MLALTMNVNQKRGDFLKHSGGYVFAVQFDISVSRNIELAFYDYFFAIFNIEITKLSLHLVG